VSDEGTASILVVDDERFFREAITDILAAEDFDCVSCEDGEGALKLIATREFGLAIVDICLPAVDGIEILRQLRAAQPEIRVIMLSSALDQERVLEALRSGASDYLAKPLHDEELVLAVRRALHDHSVVRGLSRLRNRIDELVDQLDALSQQLRTTRRDQRPRVLRDGAVRIAARVLAADKTSLVLLDQFEGKLDVVAACGRDLAPDQMGPVVSGKGIAGRALEYAMPILVADTRTARHLAADFTPARYDTHAFAVVPVTIGERAIGVLCATDCRGREPLLGEDLALLRLIGSYLAARLADESASREGLDEVVDVAGNVADPSDIDSELARRICDAMVNEVEPERLLDEALGAIETTLDADPVSLYLIDHANDALVLEACGQRGLRVDHDRLPRASGLTGSVIQRGQLVACADPVGDSRFDPTVDAPCDGKAGSLLCVPLQLRGKTVGLARIHRPAGTSVSARTGEVLASVLSAAVRNVLLYRSVLEGIEAVAEARRDARG